MVLASGVTSPWVHDTAGNYASIYYLVVSGTYTSQYAVGKMTYTIPQSDGITKKETWVSCPFEFMDNNGNTVSFKPFTDLMVEMCVTNRSGLLGVRDTVQSQEPIGGDTFTASRGLTAWFYSGSPTATNWYSGKSYHIFINTLHTSPTEKYLTLVGRVRTNATTMVGDVKWSDGVTKRENWVEYPYPCLSSFVQGNIATVVSNQSGLLGVRDTVQSQEPIGGDTFTASRGLTAWFYSGNPSATNFYAGKGYSIFINTNHQTPTSTNWYCPRPYPYPYY
jgi:hypothetical protein